MLAYGFFLQGIETLVKLLAIALGISLLTILFPQIRGVRKGDGVTLVNENESGMFSFLRNSSGIALQGGRKGSRIKVVLSDGVESEGIILEYEGLISSAKVRLGSREYNISVA